jgi:transcriptional regulator with XRE-family HTH domain
MKDSGSTGFSQGREVMSVLKTGKKTVSQRGRPKGRSTETRSFGPVGDLIRAHRLKLGLGLLDVAKACECSVQFISNIEHGRAPLPWNKIPQASALLKISVADLQAANLAIRSDFREFLSHGRGARGGAGKGKAPGVASALAFAAKDASLRELIGKYQKALPELRKRMLKGALAILSS